MTRSIHSAELSDSAQVVRLLEMGITNTVEIRNIFTAFRTNDWTYLLAYFSSREIPFPSMFPQDRNPSPAAIRLARWRWKRGRVQPRRQAGLPPSGRKFPGRPRKSKSERIREMLAAGATTEDIQSRLGVSSGLVRQIRFTGRQKSNA